MNFEKIIKNTDILSGLDGLKNLLKCDWCVNEQRVVVLKYIVNRYGLVNLPLEKDSDLLPSLMDAKPLPKSNSIGSTRFELAKKYGVSVSKVKSIGNGKYLIRGRVYGTE